MDLKRWRILRRRLQEELEQEKEHEELQEHRFEEDTGEEEGRCPPIRFDSGHAIITPPAERVMRRHGIDPQQLLERHCSGDWGDQSDEEESVG